MKNLIKFVCFVAVFITFSSVIKAESLGVSPASISVLNLAQGSVYNIEYLISRANVDALENIEIRVESENIIDWITIEPSKTFAFQVGENSRTINVNIIVPDNASLGEYSAKIIIVSKGSGEETGIITAAGVSTDVDLKVVSEKESQLEVYYSKITEAALDGPITLEIKVRNTGNSSGTIDKYKLVIRNPSSNDVIKELELKQKITVDGFADVSEILQFNNHELELGTYLADFQIYQGEGILYTNKLSFEVVKVDAQTEETDSNFDYSKLLYAIPVVALFLLIFIIVKRNRNNGEATKE